MSCEKREDDRTPTLQVRHLEGPSAVCSSVLARCEKSSALSGPPRPGVFSFLASPGLASAWPGLAWPRKTWLRISRLRTGGRTAPDPCRCYTRKKCARFVSSFSRDTRNPHPFWGGPYVREFSPGLPPGLASAASSALLLGVSLLAWPQPGLAWPGPEKHG